MAGIFKHKKLWIWILVILAAAAIAFYIWNQVLNSRAESLASMETQETSQIEKRTLVDSISASGTVTSVGSENVKADVSGVKVAEVYVKTGDRVEAGDIICMLDSTDIEEDLADAKTTLNATAGKTNIDLSSSQRSLNEAQTTRNIEVERSNQDAADAWNDYMEALADLEEAENDYNEAIETTYEKNGEYEYRKEQLEEAEEKIGGTQSVNQSSRIETEFTTVVNELKGYISGDGSLRVKDGAYDNLYITNGSLSSYTYDSIVILPEKSISAPIQENEDEEGEGEEWELAAEGSGEGEEWELTAEGSGEDAEADQAAERIDGYLGQLKGLQKTYQEAQASEAEYQNAQSEYQALQSEVTTWEQKYNTAKNEENSLKTAYEQAVTTAESKLDTYNQKIRSQEDTVRNNESTVSAKEENLKTSQLNATTSGLSDKQQIRQYEEQIAECTVRASMSGIITELSVEAGDTYSSGASIAKIENIDDYEVSSEIDEYDIGKVKTGQAVVIKTNGTGDKELSGIVKEIAPRATANSTDVTYTVIISIDTPCRELKLDMTAKLSIILESRKNVLTVPYDSVVEDEEGSFYIEVVSDKERQSDSAGDDSEPSQRGKADNSIKTEKIKVTKGIESDYYVEVSGIGIEEGMTVIVPKSLEDNSDIQNMMNRMGPMGGF
ncbi:MAG: HlyD family efflux transporter periplasmic adaptor subunit [Lachnospiraceae bacterium]|nr:HlyD family efflux transporter periplasmic adaptor subunit [Lachnospiraceae bacterium]